MRSELIITLVAVQLACAGTRAERTTTADAIPAPAPAVTQAPAATTSTAVDPAIKIFQDRVAAYVAIRSKADDGIPKLQETADPQQIADRERALGEALIKARASAKIGDVYAPEFVPVLTRIIKDDFAKRTAAERKALIVELPKGVKFGINQVYPTTIPLTTFPANLLKALPDLPPDMEYRIVHRNLILRDVKANYVIDMVPNVFPIPV
jgi:hypothetical protein